MTTFRSRIENIWYHYKVRILFGLFVVAALVFCLYSCMTRQTYDLQVYYVTTGSYYKEQTEWLEQSLAAFCPDANGDGEITVSVTHIPVGNNVDPSERAQNMTAVHAGDIFLFFGDAGGIEYLYQNGFIQPLEQHIEANEYAWSVSNSAYSQVTPGFDLFSAQPLYLSLRVFDGTWASGRDQVQKNYETAMTVLEKIWALGPKVPAVAE